MYESFFGFKEKPFNITPDPKYLYLSEQHEEAIAHLLYGIQERGGFVVITGEVGTGKTTLCRYLMNRLDDRTECAIIFNPNLSEIELLQSINEDFGIDSSGERKKELIDELNRFLLEERLRGKNMVLIIDEAQNLLPVVLEEIRMLSNLETEKEKLIQIILTGQPQLKQLLARPELRQFDQRVTARYHLRPLSKKETFKYIQHRLGVASNGDKIRFDPSAMRVIYRFSKGTPRLINVVCDRALLGAFTTGKQSPISKKIVKQAIKEVMGPPPTLHDRLSLDRTAVTLFVLPFLLMLTLVASWAVLNVVDVFREPSEHFSMAEIMPHLPGKKVEKAPAVAQTEETEKVPAVVQTEETEKVPAVVQIEDTEEALPVIIDSVSMTASEDTVIAKPPAEYTPYSEEDKNKLVEMLLSQSRGKSKLDAARNLLSLWDKEASLTQADAESFYTLAMNQKMRCTEFWTTLDGLRSSNLPCILEMFVPQQTDLRYAVLAEMGPTNATILYGDSASIQLPLELLDAFWMRRAYIFWRDFERVDEIIEFGDRGGDVVWLQASLQALGFYSKDLTGVYDTATEQAVRNFQQKNYLMLDGVVGPRTRLALYAQLMRYSMPRLNRENI